MNQSAVQSIEATADGLLNGAELCADALHLALGDCRIRVRSNSRKHLAQLGTYFGHVIGPKSEADLDVIAIERTAPDADTDLGVSFTDWRREPGKTERKDSFVDLPGARLIRKVRTGMVFLQSETARIAAGPCLQYDNQVINFINAQYMNWLQHRGWHICHAAGLVYHERTLGIAGFSGGGKSTLMLRLLEHPQVNYLTNDRLFVRREGETVQAAGIPKLPRINPGTIVHNARLHSLITPQQRAALLELPADKLWHLEDKYDVLVDEVYGANRITPAAPLGAFLVLNWQRESSAPLRVEPIDLNQRRDLLGAIMKSPGPFYQYPDGRFYRDDISLDAAAYLDQLGGLPVFEASGRVNFEDLEQCALQRLLAPQEAQT